MKNKDDIAKLVEETIEVPFITAPVQVPLDFKEKVMQELFSEKEEEVQASPWFTPQWQLATLILFLLINGSIIYYNVTSDYDQDVQTFAESFDLSPSSSSTILD